MARKVQGSAQGVKHAIKEAMKDRALTAPEAKKIVAQAKKGGVNAAEKRAVQALVNRYGDRFEPAAARTITRVAPQNNAVSTVTRGVQQGIASGGKISRQEMTQLQRALSRNGLTQAERRELDRQIAANRQNLSPAARASYDRFRIKADRTTPNPFNQKLPSAPGDLGNRIRNPRPYAPNHPELFAIKPGTRMVDGQGRDRGALDPHITGVALNYGQRKIINGQAHVYAFSTEMNGKRASGWIPESALANGPVSHMPTIKTPKPRGGDMEGTYTITGLRRGKTGPAATFGDRKVLPRVPREDNVAASDYMLREGGVVNMLYNLPGVGGVSNDTVFAGAKFVRAAGVKPVTIQLYKPESEKKAGTMTFVYGRVGDRYGWIAHAALRKDRPS